MPKHVDIAVSLYEKNTQKRTTFPHVRHIFIKGVYRKEYLSHHAVEVFDTEENHFVVQWSMGSETGMSDEEKREKDAKIQEASEDVEKLKELSQTGNVCVEPWEDFMHGWDKATVGGAKIQMRLYEERFSDEEVFHRLAAVFGCEPNKLHEATPVSEIYVQEYGKYMGYSCRANNCEHFVVSMFTGFHSSAQTDFFMKYLGKTPFAQVNRPTCAMPKLLLPMPNGEADTERAARAVRTHLPLEVLLKDEQAGNA